MDFLYQCKYVSIYIYIYGIIVTISICFPISYATEYVKFIHLPINIFLSPICNLCIVEAPVIEEAIADGEVSSDDAVIAADGSPSSGPDMAALISEGCQPPNAGGNLEGPADNASPRSSRVPEIWQPASSDNDCLRSAPAVLAADREQPQPAEGRVSGKK